MFKETSGNEIILITCIDYSEQNVFVRSYGCSFFYVLFGKTEQPLHCHADCSASCMTMSLDLPPTTSTASLATITLIFYKKSQLDYVCSAGTKATA